MTAAQRWAAIDGLDSDTTPPAFVAWPTPEQRCGDPMLDAARHWPTVPLDVAERLRA